MTIIRFPLKKKIPNKRKMERKPAEIRNYQLMKSVTQQNNKLAIKMTL